MKDRRGRPEYIMGGIRAGCAYAVIRGALKGTAPDCSCSCDSNCC